ncbi:MAG: hypothetical protein HRU09_09705 [Oligoflexales bacterium]|nr:hypothetical protein [Oligoflexales bacterium]
MMLQVNTLRVFLLLMSLLGSKALVARTIKNKDALKKDFFSFVVDLSRWAAKAQLKLKERESRQEIHFRFSRDEYYKLEQTFEHHREVLYGLSKYTDLNTYNGIEILPKDLYLFIRHNFLLSKRHDPIDPYQILVRIAGGSFHFPGKKEIVVKGFLEKVDEFTMSEWLPVSSFINHFKDTLTLDSRLAKHLGRILLPLIHHYYDHMDTVSRLRLFKELADDYKDISLAQGNKPQENSLNELVIKIFQNSGPVIIKFLQQLQEEAMGESPITPILAGLKHSKPMNPREARSLTTAELRKITGQSKLSDFKFDKKPLGIASIAQTHRFFYRGRPYIVKLQKNRVRDVFEREKVMLANIFNNPDIASEFDKGMKQSIQNMIHGIEEELNFNVERQNIIQGKRSYSNEAANIHVVSIPLAFKNSIAYKSQNTLIMSLANGVPLGDVMVKGGPEDLSIAYKRMLGLYSSYIYNGLSPEVPTNFYHGDLHRENVFIDLNSDDGHAKLTLIDFGNAGVIQPRLRRSLINIMQHTKHTNTRFESFQDSAILKLSQELKKLIVETNAMKNNDNETQNLLNTFFQVCFNPNGSVDDKSYTSRRLFEQNEELESQKALLKLEISKEGADIKALESKIEKITDQMDFIRALTGNCLNGVTNPLLTALGDQNTVSEKLATVFQELLKNGIALPKELIFFNKSKSLLEGILTNIAQRLDDANAQYHYIEPDDLFEKELNNLSKSQQSFFSFWQ